MFTRNIQCSYSCYSQIKTHYLNAFQTSPLRPPPSTQGNLILVRYSLGKPKLREFSNQGVLEQGKKAIPTPVPPANTWPSTCFFACLKLSQSKFLMYKFTLFFRRCLNFTAGLDYCCLDYCCLDYCCLDCCCFDYYVSQLV